MISHVLPILLDRMKKQNMENLEVHFPDFSL